MTRCHCSPTACGGAPTWPPRCAALARAFELLELAAVHLYLLPWRKEFTTIKVGRRAAWKFPAPGYWCWAPPGRGLPLG